MFAVNGKRLFQTLVKTFHIQKIISIPYSMILGILKMKIIKTKNGARKERWYEKYEEVLYILISFIFWLIVLLTL